MRIFTVGFVVPLSVIPTKKIIYLHRCIKYHVSVKIGVFS